MSDPMLNEITHLEAALEAITKTNAVCLVEVDRLAAENDTLRDLIGAYHGHIAMLMEHINSLVWMGKLHALQQNAEHVLPTLKAKEHTNKHE